MNTNSIANISIEKHIESLNVLSRHTVPILCGSSIESLRFKGSSIYIVKDYEYFLATAFHVVKDENPKEIMLLQPNNRAKNILFHQQTVIESHGVDLVLYRLIEPLESFVALEYSRITDILSLLSGLT